MEDKGESTKSIVLKEILRYYQPYGLKVNSGNGIDVFKGNVVDIAHLELTNTYVDKITPIFRKLTDLTKEEWYQVFMAEFNDKAKETLPTNFKLRIHTNDGKNMLSFQAFLFDLKHGFRGFNPSYSIVKYHNFNFKVSGWSDFNALRAFNKLFQLHADVFYCIDKKIAMDKKLVEF